MYELGILFSYHEDTNVTRTNLAALIESNPTIPVIPISNGDVINDSCHISQCGKLGRKWLALGTNKWNKWKNADLPYFAWYATCKSVECKRWILIEYDVYCKMSLIDFVAPTSQYDFVGCTITMPTREHNWYWFVDQHTLTEELKKFACGSVPLVCTIISDKAMQKMTQYYLDYVDNHLDHCPCELRIGTIANFLGFSPVPNCHPQARNITWMSVYDKTFAPKEGLWHPIKHLIQ